MKKLFILFSALYFTASHACDYWSEEPYYKALIKKQEEQRARDNMYTDRQNLGFYKRQHDELTKEHTRNKCPKNAQFTLFQTYFSSDWIKTCKEIQHKLDENNDNIKKLANRITIFEKKEEIENMKSKISTLENEIADIQKEEN